MANTFTLISSATVGVGGASSIDFTSIPATYTDLVVLYSLRNANGSTYADLSVTFTGATGTGGKVLYGLSGGVGTYSPSSSQNYYGETNGGSSTANTFSNGSLYIPNYTNSTNKSLSGDAVVENNSSSNVMILASGNYSSSSAITAISLSPAGTTFVQYSTAYLYGVKNA